MFVADVQKSQRGKNIESLNQLYENLKTYQLDLFKMPLVMQYNKVDLRKSDVETLDSKTLQSISSGLPVTLNGWLVREKESHRGGHGAGGGAPEAFALDGDAPSFDLGVELAHHLADEAIGRAHPAWSAHR